MKLRAFIPILLLLVASSAKAQFDPGPARFKTNFDCAQDGAVFPPLGDGGFFDSLYHVPNLCASASDLELRFFNGGMAYPQELLIVRNQKGLWSATLYEVFFGKDGFYLDSLRNAQEGLIRVAQPVPECGFDAFWKRLRTLRVLEQPMALQSKGPFRMPVCGSHILISFKAGDRFGSYYINNADYLAKAYPKEPSFQQQHALVQLFRELMATTYPVSGAKAGTSGSEDTH